MSLQHTFEMPARERFVNSISFIIKSVAGLAHKLMHALTDVRFGRRRNKMKVIRHQNITVHDEGVIANGSI